MMGFEEFPILLVEDDEVDILNLRRAFKKNRVVNPLVIANNGLEALDYLRNNPPPPLPLAVLLDINMPKMNGIEFLEEIRKDEVLKALRVFILTTSAEDSDILSAYNFNVAGYIIKPLTFGDFEEAIRTLKDFWKLSKHPT